MVGHPCPARNARACFALPSPQSAPAATPLSRTSLLLHRQYQVKPRFSFICLRVVLGDQFLMPLSADLDVDMRLPVDIIGGRVGLETIPAIGADNHCGPVGIIIFPLQVDQPEFDTASRQGPTPRGRKDLAAQDEPFAHRSTNWSAWPIKRPNFIKRRRAAILG